MKKLTTRLFSFILLIFPVAVSSQTTDVISVGTTSYTVPCGVTSITVNVWGGGGGGGKAQQTDWEQDEAGAEALPEGFAHGHMQLHPDRSFPALWVPAAHQQQTDQLLLFQARVLHS